MALTQLFRLPNLDRDRLPLRISSVMGSLFVAMGIAIMVMGLIRYFHVQAVLQQGDFPATRGMVIILFGLTFSLVIVSLVILIQTAVRMWN